MRSRSLPLARSVVILIGVALVLLTVHHVRAATTIQSNVCQSNHISIDSPVNGAHVTAKNLEVSGHSAVGAKIVVSVNSVTSITTSAISDGSFVAEVPLAIGINHIAATSHLCDQILQSRTITVSRSRQNYLYLWLGLLFLLIVLVLRRRRHAKEKGGSKK